MGGGNTRVQRTFDSSFLDAVSTPRSPCQSTQTGFSRKRAAGRVVSSALTVVQEAYKIPRRLGHGGKRVRNWMLCSCIALALSGFALAQQPAAVDKPPLR